MPRSTSCDSLPTVRATLQPLQAPLSDDGIACGEPSLPEGVDPASLRRYHQLATQLRTLEAHKPEPALATAQSTLSTTRTSLTARQKQLASLHNRVSHDQKKLSRAEDPFVLKKLLMPTACSKYQQRRQAKLDGDNAALAKAATAVAQLTQQERMQAASTKELIAAVSQLVSLRSQEASIVESLFASPTTNPLCDHTERQLTQHVASLAPRLAALQSYQVRYSQAEGLLEAGLSKLLRGHRMLCSALQLANIDVMGATFRTFEGAPFGNSPGGVFVDMMERQNAQEGVALAQAAVADIIAAKTLCPDVPRIDLQYTRQFGAGFGQIFFDNIFTDIAVRNKIIANLRSVDRMESDVRAAVAWMRNTLNVQVLPDLARLQQEDHATRASLNSHRRHMLDAAVAALQQQGGAQARPAQAQPQAQRAAGQVCGRPVGQQVVLTPAVTVDLLA